MEDFVKETSKAIIIILSVVMAIYLVAYLYSSATSKATCLDAGYFKSAVTYNFTAYCQSFTGTVLLSEVVGNE